MCFLVCKVSGGGRPFIDLKGLLHTLTHFTSQCLRIVKSRDFPLKIHLDDAYFHASIHREVALLRLREQGVSVQGTPILSQHTS